MITFNTGCNYETKIHHDDMGNIKITQPLDPDTPIRIIGGNSSSISSAASSIARKPTIILPYDDESPQHEHDILRKISTAEVLFDAYIGAHFNQTKYDFLINLKKIMLGYNKEWKLKYVGVFLDHVILNYYRSNGGTIHTAVLPISDLWCLYLCVPAHGKDAAERYTIHAYDGQVFVDTEYIEGNSGVIRNVTISAHSNRYQVTRYYQQPTLSSGELSVKLRRDANDNYRY